ncbi:dUTP diphosphatase [Rhizobium leguminosarum]|uniref:dUTP diphosphatase n=1 Tax=Rhizobium leguminosarum TaxID=384 RepID=UPI001441FE22|nr:dUTP diphosphatase [Rhizobium leguminosarum]MBY5427854.1 dUTP diphosphatase [Rhizobium leguminosarum]NKL87371.1 dUTP diphosphatase [Rhizobium leguminosarum bv. viciae]
MGGGGSVVYAFRSQHCSRRTGWRGRHGRGVACQDPVAECARPAEYQTAGAAGADLFATLDSPAIDIAPHARAIILMGIALEMPFGTEAQIRPRSGLAAKRGVTVLNSTGTIDSDYRGEIEVILLNTSEVNFSVRSGERIAQIIFAPVLRTQFEQADELSVSGRRADGIGSTLQ